MTPQDTQANHPVPAHSRIGMWALSFALLGAPVAWSLQILIGVPLAGHFCYPTTTSLATPAWSGLWAGLLTISFIAIVISALATFVALGAYRKTRGEHSKWARSITDVSAGRDRFLAACGLMTGIEFLIALIFTTTMLFLVPVCNGLT